jgi:hypothetical protein
VSAADQQKGGFPALERETDDLEPTATFVFKCSKKLDSVSDTGQKARSDLPEVVRVDSEGKASPVTCITISPAFWKRRVDETHDEAKEETEWKNADNKSSDNTYNTSREEDVSPANRDSFCSALSSASAASSVCDYQDEAERDKDSYVSEGDLQEEHGETDVVEKEESDKKKLEMSPKIVNEYDHYKVTDNDKEEGMNEVAKTIVECDQSNEPTDKEEIHSEHNESQKQNKNLPEGLLPECYETEVHSTICGSSKAGKQKRILKTRRISDTHIGYKRNIDSKIISEKETSKFGTDKLICNGGNGKNTTETDSEETSREGPECTSPISCQTDIKCRASIGEDQKVGRELRSGGNYNPTSGSTGMRFRQLCSVGREDRHSPSEPGISRTNLCAQYPRETCARPTPDNVFVKTTRKIFSPVRRDSGGKASSVISYVVGETSGMDESDVFQEVEQTAPSPVISLLRREETRNLSNETSLALQRKENVGHNGKPPPSWMFTRNRSQSSSPALTRRAVSRAADKSCNDTTSTSDSNSILRSQNKLPYMKSQIVARTVRSSSEESRFESDSKRGHESKLQLWKENVEKKNEGDDESEKSVKQQNSKSGPDVQSESLLEISRKGRGNNSTSFNHTTTYLSSLPLLPQSPNLARRDLIKVPTKETAPNIRMMIAKYNQKLTEQQEGAGGRSPEVTGSGSASPVAWRSPAAERRVMAQMEKYQEEVQRVLQQGGKKISTHVGGNKVQKSASAGIIRTSESLSVMESKEGSNKDSTDTTGTKPLTELSNRRNILKCPSAGSIKSATTVVPVTANESRAVDTALSSKTDRDTAKLPPSSPHNASPSPSSPSSPETGLHHSSPPPSRLRALRLQRAKEEFLTRGPGGRSWTSDGGTSTDTPSASVSPEPFWGRDVIGGIQKDILRPSLRLRENDNGKSNRLSQVSVGSESSCDGSVIITRVSVNDTSTVSDEGVLLVKSASAGMINIDPNTYSKFNDESESVDIQPSTSDIHDNKTKTQACSRFGISSIASRFRRVKMRRNKDREGGKMNTISVLCRQSLLVDLHLSKSGSSSGVAEVPGPSTSKSCPSSPVLQRPSSIEKPEAGACSAPASWILNPARRIFKPK